MDWTLVDWPRLTAMTAGLILVSPLAWLIDARLLPALHRLDVGPRRSRQIRSLAQSAVGLIALLLALWGAGLSLGKPLVRLGEQPLTVNRFGLFLASLAVLEGLSRLLGNVIERQSTWLEPGHRSALAHLVRWGLLVVLGLSLLGWLGFGIRDPLLLLSGKGVSPFQLALFGVYLATVLIGSRVLGALVERRLLARTRLTAGARYAMGRIINYAVLVVGLVTSLELLGVQLGSLTVMLGALGVGIGFGLQNVVNNFVSGLLLLVERPLQIGDLVELDGVRGRVTRIGGRSTTVRTPENIAIVIPNGDLIANKLTNWTQADSKTRIAVALRLEVGTDIQRLKPLLVALAGEHASVLPRPEPRVTMTRFDETGVDLELQVWIDTRSTQPATVTSDLYFGCYRLFEEQGFHVPPLPMVARPSEAAVRGTSRP